MAVLGDRASPLSFDEAWPLVAESFHEDSALSMLGPLTCRAKRGNKLQVNRDEHHNALLKHKFSEEHT